MGVGGCVQIVLTMGYERSTAQLIVGWSEEQQNVEEQPFSACTGLWPLAAYLKAFNAVLIISFI